MTGVCSTRNLDMVRSIGADQVIDYTQKDCTQNGQRYDLILDTAAYRSASDYQRVLSPKGTYVMVGGSTVRMFQMMILGPWISMTGSKKMDFLVSKPNQQDLGVLKDLIEAGKVAPVIDRRCKLSEVPEAIRYLEAGHTQGKVVITV